MPKLSEMQDQEKNREYSITKRWEFGPKGISELSIVKWIMQLFQRIPLARRGIKRRDEK